MLAPGYILCMSKHYTWAEYVGTAATSYKVKVTTKIESLDESFEIQAWCIDHLGGRWATTPPGIDCQDWFFVSEPDATLFRLRWFHYI